jgi:hydroxymethylbilane synthase
VQAEFIAAALRSGGHRVELVGVTTDGDRSADAGQLIVESSRTGVFVGELRSRLLAGEIDLVVHSLKDLPTTPHEGLMLGAIPLRQDPRDALVARDGSTLAALAAGAVVGTGSPRRAAQLRAIRADLEVRPIRGNVDTRLRKVADGEFDAAVLAAAGLARLGRLDEASEILDPGQLLPAPAQGALAIECRADDEPLARALREALDDRPTRAAVTAERRVLARLEAGCSAPVGALADVSEAEDGGEEIYLRAVVAALDGSQSIRLSVTGPLADASALGDRLADDLLEAGAADLMTTEPTEHPASTRTTEIGDRA